MIHDRDAIFSTELDAALKGMAVRVIRTPVRAPSANAFCERLIGTIRRECLDRVIVWNERSLRRTLRGYLDYYHRWRTHLALDKDAPESRTTQAPEHGAIVECAHVHGLHHHYERRAA